MNQTISRTTRVDALFVAWQDQQSKRYFPIGRLVRHSNGHGPLYEFCYLNGCEKAREAGFTKLLAFPDLKEVYKSNGLFPLFENRLMPRKRPDFNEYVARVSLDNDADDFEILARSGGRRATDSLELFPMPNLATDGCYETYFLAHGLRYLPASHDRIDLLLKDERLYPMADFQNDADSDALALRTEDRVVVGYLPRYILPDAWTLQESCGYIEVFVHQVNHSPAPLQQRLLCRMKSCWPSDFKPFCTNEYLPIADSATKLDCSESTHL